MRILFFGDSITQGFWDTEGGWVNRIRKQYDQRMLDRIDDDPPTVFNLGVSGDSSDTLLKRIENETKARATEELALVIAIGTNDSRTKAGVEYSNTERYKQNLTEIAKIVKQYSDKLLFVGLTPCDEERSNPVAWGDTGYTNERIQAFDNTLKQFCQDEQIPYVEIFKPFSEAGNVQELLPDSLHPGDRGHQLIADLVLPKIEKLINAKLDSH